MTEKNAVPTKENARHFEKSGQLLQAAEVYEQLLKLTPSGIPILKRLMIIYRKMKAYKKEVLAIDKTIKIFELKYRAAGQYDLKVSSLSKKLNTLLGHTDKNGTNLLIIPEVARLEKRKATVLKRLK